MALKQIRWGIIGCGNVTETKSGPAFQQIKGSEIRAVMRRDSKKNRRLCQTPWHCKMVCKRRGFNQRQGCKCHLYSDTSR